MLDILKKALRKIFVMAIGASFHRKLFFRWSVARLYHRLFLSHPLLESVKCVRISAQQKRLAYTTFIETGTYLGDTIASQVDHFQQVISIELGKDLYEKACERFKHHKHVRLYHGDSGKILKAIMPSIDTPCIFWLDGHYSYGITAKGSKETPIVEELSAILNAKPLPHYILIDDARCFRIPMQDYPTIEAVKQQVWQKRKQARIRVSLDAIEIQL